MLQPRRRRSFRAVLTVVTALVAGLLVSAASTDAHAHGSPKKLLWSDEFNGPALGRISSKWEVQYGGAWGDNELQQYTGRLYNVRLSGTGKLQLVARRESFTGRDGIHRYWTSARVMGTHPFRYGYLVANMKIPKGQGLWPAFWTLGADIRNGVQWPYTGEIDVMEAINQVKFVGGNLHGPDTKNHSYYSMNNAGTVWTDPNWTERWHQYGVYWTDSSITWYVDGTAIGTVRKADLPSGYSWEFGKPHVPILNIAVGGAWPGSPNSSTPNAAMMSVSSVRLFNHP